MGLFPNYLLHWIICKNMSQSLNMVHFHFTPRLKAHQLQNWMSISRELAFWMVFEDPLGFMVMARLGLCVKWPSGGFPFRDVENDLVRQGGDLWSKWFCEKPEGCYETRFFLAHHKQWTVSFSPTRTKGGMLFRHFCTVEGPNWNLVIASLNCNVMSNLWVHHPNQANTIPVSGEVIEHEVDEADVDTSSPV